MADALTAERRAELREQIDDGAGEWPPFHPAEVTALLDAADEADRLRGELAAVVRKADHGCYGHPCKLCDG